MVFPSTLRQIQKSQLIVIVIGEAALTLEDPLVVFAHSWAPTSSLGQFRNKTKFPEVPQRLNTARYQTLQQRSFGSLIL